MHNYDLSVPPRLFREEQSERKEDEYFPKKGLFSLGNGMHSPSEGQATRTGFDHYVKTALHFYNMSSILCIFALDGAFLQCRKARP